MSWTKGDFDSAYATNVLGRFFFDHPELNTRKYPQVRLHYHRWYVAPRLRRMWGALQPDLEIPVSSRILVVGAGFGWGIEALNELGYVNVVGIDDSPWIHEEKDNTEEASIRQAIQTAEIDPDGELGQALLEYAGAYTPRSKSVILDEDMSTKGSRAIINEALGGWPDVVVFENIVYNNTTKNDVKKLDKDARKFPNNPRVIWLVQMEFRNVIETENEIVLFGTGTR